MRVSPINICLNRTINKNTNFCSVKTLNNDTISFRGGKVSDEKLDEYLGILAEKMAVIKREKAAIASAEKDEEIAVDEINSQIEPLLEDNDFLWAITLDKELEKYSRFIVSYMMESDDEESGKQAFDIVFSTIRSHIFKTEATQLLEEFEEAKKQDLKPEYKERLDQLEGFVTQKKEVQDKFSQQVYQIYSDDAGERLDIDIRKQKLKDSTNVDEDTFNSELVKRAFKTGESLKVSYDELYKKYYDEYRYYYVHYVDAKRDALKKANETIINYLETGEVEDLPF